MDHNSSLVNLSIPQSVTQPIVEAKIQEAVLAAMGGADRIVEAVVHRICNTKISPKDGKVSSYSSDNTTTWMDFHVSKIIEDGIQKELERQTIELASPVRDALIKEIQTKSGANKLAKEIMAAMGSESKSDLVVTFGFRKVKGGNDW